MPESVKPVEDIRWQSDNLDGELELLKRPHFVVLDIETTGYSPQKGGRIIQIAAVRVLNGRIGDTFSTLVNPQLKIPAKIANLTGISNEDVANQPTIYQILPDFYRFIGDAVVVGHNVEFDWNRFLLPAFQKVGIFPNNDTLCTMKLFKKLVPGLGRGGYRLDTMCELLNIPFEHHHQATDDTVGTAKCLIEFIRKLAPEALERKRDVGPMPARIAHTPVKVKQVKYWEKRKNKREMFRRLYVRLSTGTEWGTVYFDIPTRTWGNKDFPLPLDFEKVEEAVIRFLGLKSQNDLLYYRN